MKELIKVVFELPEGDVATAETLWAKPLGNGSFELANIPALAYGVNLGDVIRAVKGEDGRYYFEGVVSRSGHRTFRIVPDGAADRVADLRVLALSIGGQVERTGESYLTIDLPPTAPDDEFRALLAQGASAEAWEFEESGAG